MVIKWTDKAGQELHQEIVKGLVEEFKKEGMYKKVEKEYQNASRIELEGRG